VVEKSRSHPHLDIINSYARDSIKQYFGHGQFIFISFAKFLLFALSSLLFPHPVSIPFGSLKSERTAAGEMNSDEARVTKQILFKYG